MVRVCKNCQKEFFTSQSTSVWCSDSCGDKWKYRNRPWYVPRAKTKRQCQKCGGDYMSQWQNSKHCDPCRAPIVRQCQGCGKDIPRRRYCDDCRKFYYATRMGVSIPDARRAWEESDGKCAICRRAPTGKKKRLSLDHCHKTNRARGFICDQCNFGLGSFNDNPDYLVSAVEYLTRRRS